MAAWTCPAEAWQRALAGVDLGLWAPSHGGRRYATDERRRYVGLALAAALNLIEKPSRVS